MKNIFKSALLLLCSVCLFTACEDDNDSNPVLKSPTQFVLNTPALANSLLDLENSSSIELTCSQPDYGFPAYTAYKVQVATSSDMADATELSTTYNTAKMDVDAAELASTLTTLFLNKGKTEADFPMTVPVYLRARAVMKSYDGSDVDGTEILSNVVCLNTAYLKYSLPPVTVPENFYVVGQFCGWSWDKCVDMVPVYGTDNVFWRMVYIDDSGIKFNSAKAWDGGEVGYAGITVSGDLASEITDGGGNIASTNPGWYLMILTANIEGRNIKYDVQFQKPEVRFIGLLVGGWDEGLGEAFSVPSTADGEFVSPEIATTLAGNDTDGCVRIYVKVPSFDWWKSEFIVFSDNKITYRGLGGDQDRVGCVAGQRVYLNFSNDTGSIK